MKPVANTQQPTHTLPTVSTAFFPHCCPQTTQEHITLA